MKAQHITLNLYSFVSIFIQHLNENRKVERQDDGSRVKNIIVDEIADLFFLVVVHLHERQVIWIFNLPVNKENEMKWYNIFRLIFRWIIYCYYYYYCLMKVNILYFYSFDESLFLFSLVFGGFILNRRI